MLKKDEIKKEQISKAYKLTQSFEETAKLCGYKSREGLRKYLKKHPHKVIKILVFKEIKINEK